MTKNGKHINYYQFINSTKNEYCNKALLEIFPMINLDKTRNIINNTPYLLDVYKKFYNKVIETSYNLVLTPAYQKVFAKSKNNDYERMDNKYDFDPSDEIFE